MFKTCLEMSPSTSSENETEIIKDVDYEGDISAFEEEVEEKDKADEEHAEEGAGKEVKEDILQAVEGVDPVDEKMQHEEPSEEMRKHEGTTEGKPPIILRIKRTRVSEEIIKMKNISESRDVNVEVDFFILWQLFFSTTSPHSQYNKFSDKKKSSKNFEVLLIDSLCLISRHEKI